jgi:hypothetical protein
MIMKKIVCLIFADVAISVCAQVEPPKHDWNVTLKVVDETGHPVEGAIRIILHINTQAFQRPQFLPEFHL